MNKQQYMKEWAQRNKPWKTAKRKKYMSNYYQKNKDQIREHRRLTGKYKRDDIRKYGITVEQYNRMLEKQENKCAICRQSESRKNQYGIQSLGIDHSHKTNKVRGLLCDLCNRGLGFFRDDAILLRKAAKYLGKNL